MTIHNWKTRALISFFVFLCVFLIVVPHLMDVQPPFLVNALLWPVYLIGPAIGRILPHGNIGTTEHPVYEATPIDFLVGFALVGFSIFLYPVVTFVVLSWYQDFKRERSIQEWLCRSVKQFGETAIDLKSEFVIRIVFALASPTIKAASSQLSIHCWAQSS